MILLALLLCAADANDAVSGEQVSLFVGSHIRADSASKVTNNGNGTLGVFLSDGQKTVGLTNFHVLYRKAFMNPAKCSFIRGQFRGVSSVCATGENLPADGWSECQQVGGRTKQWYFPRGVRCLSSKSTRGFDAAVFAVDEDVSWSN